MAKPKTRKKRAPKRVLALPDLEHAKTAVQNSLTSSSGQRTSDHAIREYVSWYCSEPRPSVDGSKPAIDRHFKTGHHERGGRDQWSSTSWPPPCASQSGPWCASSEVRI
jgi:hypothetical protein